MAKGGSKPGQIHGVDKRRRIDQVQAWMGMLMSDKEILARLKDEYGIGKSQGYADITSARERSFSREDRERMHHGVIEGLRNTYRMALAKTRRVTFVCASCGEENEGAQAHAPRLDLAMRAIDQLCRVLKLEFAPEDLLSDDALAERVAHHTIEHLHLWSAHNLAKLKERLKIIEAQREGGQNE